jgi:hypothetical protein
MCFVWRFPSREAALYPKTAIALGTPFARASASAHCPLRSTHHKVRLGKVQCANAEGFAKGVPNAIAESGLKSRFQSLFFQKEIKNIFLFAKTKSGILTKMPLVFL